MGEAGQVVGPRVGLVGPPIVDRSNILCHFGSRDIRLRIVDTSRNFDPPTHTWWTLVRPGTTGAAKKLFGNNGEIFVSICTHTPVVRTTISEGVVSKF